jgi:glutamate/tyrosine decarboxylase-like PLP-dependent enzyme
MALPPIEKWYLYRFIGNDTVTTIQNNNHFQAHSEIFLIDDFETLRRMKPGQTGVVAYWLPDETGAVNTCYLYQEETYIGSATNVSHFRYNESKFEATGDDEAKQLKQQKRRAKFYKEIRVINESTCHLGIQKTEDAIDIKTTEVEIVPDSASVDVLEHGYDIDDYVQGDWGSVGLTMA